MSTTHRLTDQQSELLIEIVTLAPISTADLAAHVKLTESATRGSVKRLAKRGLVEESYINGGHTRLLHWVTTDAGEALAEELTA